MANYARCWALMVNAGLQDFVIPIRDDAVTQQGIRVAIKPLLFINGEVATELWRWPDESWAEFAGEMLATFAEEHELHHQQHGTQVVMHFPPL